MGVEDILVTMATTTTTTTILCQTGRTANTTILRSPMVIPRVHVEAEATMFLEEEEALHHISCLAVVHPTTVLLFHREVGYSVPVVVS